MTLKADEYRAKARECEELAQQMRGSLKQQLIEIADKWRTWLLTKKSTRGPY